MPTYVGGSFAPPLPANKLAEYETLASAADAEVKQHMLALIEMVRVFNQTPPSVLPGTPWPAGGAIVPLEAAEIQRIWDVVPWKLECDMMATVFSRLPVGPLRDAAFHLQWFANELSADREPLTQDRLK